MVSVEYIRHFFGALGHTSPELFNFACETGVKWIRRDAKWNNIEVTEGDFDFSEFDKVNSICKNSELKVLPIYNTVPEWGSAGPAGAERRTHYPPEGEMIDKWQDFVASLCKRYPDIEYFEIWNEPNIKHFLKVQENHKDYVDKLLIPAAKVLQSYDRKIVAPSFTLEWPYDGNCTGFSFNLAANIETINKWLNYQEAWQYIDILSVHYVKGDTNKLEMTGAENMMPFYDYIYQNWIETGKLEGIWDTEAGLTATEVSSDYGFVALEPWERPPYAQWIARYYIPVLHWSIDHNWDYRDKYKVFWYHFNDKKLNNNGILAPSNLLKKNENNQLDLSESGQALKVLIKEITDAEQVGTYNDFKVGFGLHSPGEYYQFKSYGFKLDNDLFVAAWLDLPGIEFETPQQTKIEAIIEGIGDNRAIKITTVNYITGKVIEVKDYSWEKGMLKIKISRTADPVLYFKIENSLS